MYRLTESHTNNRLTCACVCVYIYELNLPNAGQLLDWVLEKKNTHSVILGATSGDTGSAAIAGVQHESHSECVFATHTHKTCYVCMLCKHSERCE